jgi:hypothetical protein
LRYSDPCSFSEDLFAADNPQYVADPQYVEGYLYYQPTSTEFLFTDKYEISNRYNLSPGSYHSGMLFGLQHLREGGREKIKKDWTGSSSLLLLICQLIRGNLGGRGEEIPTIRLS